LTGRGGPGAACYVGVRARRIVPTASGTTSTAATAATSVRMGDWHHARLSAVLLGAFAAIGGFSIGLFYVPVQVPVAAGAGR
jgi:hypothetical protein